ncbi:MAG: FAD-dependent oxidoreductase [Planctomycetota bacterium]|jgi:glycine/D-amino acid oxidase-like deaminating enzyme|nr:FAD-dependent oxidoreductase [Planctomycetota bacterium]
MSYDVVIIGAGPSGIAAAARLGHFGAKVCLVEAHSRPGGLNSWHHVRGHEISSGLHAFTNYVPSGKGGPLGRLLRQLRIRFSDLGLRPQRRSRIRFPGVDLAFSNDAELIRQQIAERFPREADSFDRFRARINATDEGEITSRQTSARDVMETYIRDPLLADMLFCPVLFYGGPGGVGDGRDAGRVCPDMDWLLFCVVWKCIFESGFAYPAHGVRPLWENLLDRFKADGGDVRLGCRVDSLVVRGGRVAAAVTADGGEIRGDIFFSSAGGRETEQLLRKERDPSSQSIPSGEIIGEAGEIPAGTISIAEGIAVLDVPAAECGIEDTTVFYSFDEQFRFRRPDGLVDASSGVICAPGNYEGIDERIVKVTQLASYPAWRGLSADGYANGKRQTGEGMAVALEKLGATLRKPQGVPGKFGGFDDLFTPMTLQRYALHAEGALYGSPMNSRSGATSCANLFLIGTDQGFHGIVGAMLSGVAMANMQYLSQKTT